MGFQHVKRKPHEPTTSSYEDPTHLPKIQKNKAIQIWSLLSIEETI